MKLNDFLNIFFSENHTDPMNVNSDDYRINLNRQCKTEYISWIMYLLCDKILSENSESVPFITPENIEITIHDNPIDFYVSIDSSVEPNLNYMPPESENNIDASLYSIGMVFYEALCGRTLFEAENIEDAAFLPIYIESCGRESFVREDDENCGIFASVIARLTFWDPYERRDALEMLQSIINEEYDCGICIRFMKNKRIYSEQKLLLECIGETVDFLQIIPEGERILDNNICIEFRPWTLNVDIELCENKQEEPDIKSDQTTEIETNDLDIGILICEENSTVPDVFTPVGKSSESDFKLSLQWTFFSDYKNELIIYAREAGFSECIYSYDSQNHMWCIGSIKLPDTQEDITCEMSLKFERVSEDTYNVICRINELDFIEQDCISIGEYRI